MDSNQRALTSFENEVLDQLRHAAKQALAANVASLEADVNSESGVELVTLRLEPRNPESAPVSLQIDDDSLITFYIGRHSIVLECFSDERPHLLHCVERYVAAIIEGRYEEWISKDPIYDGALGVIDLKGRSVKVRYNTLRPSWLIKRTWTQVHYAPYTTSIAFNA